jgi:hypothetical protein
LECSIQITISFNLLSENILYYPAVLITKDNISEEIDLQTSAGGEDCLVVVRDDLDFSYFLTLSSIQYQFFKKIHSINYKDQMNSLYTKHNQKEFIKINPENVTYNTDR